MSTTEVSTAAGTAPGAGRVDMKLEVIVIPVSDVDRAKQFYESLGWRLDGDFRDATGRGGIQMTPKGSGCSIQFGTDMTSAQPGSLDGLHLIVSDIEEANDDLVARGVQTSGVFHCESGYSCRFPGNDEPVPGRHPERGTYGSFLTFRDPDGNGWILQEVTTRFPGRVEGDTTYASAGDLAQALKRAAAAHGEHEARTGQADADWPEWYADYMVREQRGEALPT
jgi:catechol 2,3-dioxygenase-like lactoylglutathione lyase family enzyme